MINNKIMLRYVKCKRNRLYYLCNKYYDIKFAFRYYLAKSNVKPSYLLQYN